ncbi:MAG: sigma-70 family RNA polymerase sigma factor [Flavobacteriales bacterium]|jgi:RNA polymerase sigma-70 factor (ECF subfamily)|nr:sigma-70 family RNA polymerase sigma factor [Flavobacteriales bacterium]
MTNEQLIENCLEGNARAQKMLFEKFGPKLLGVCYRYANNQDEAQDLLQDGFIKIFEKLDKYSGIGSFEGWMRRIIVNTALDNIRKNKKFQLHTDIDETGFKIPSNDFIEERLAAEDLIKILQSIPIGYKTIFNLYAIEGYSHKEIAEQLNITTSTSKSQYSRAKALLREKITKLNLK